MAEELPLAKKCEKLLAERWQVIEKRAEEGDLRDALSDSYLEIKKAIKDSLISSTKTYHYVLLNQVLCKLADPTLNAHSLMVAWGHEGAFDARSVAHAVIVPFDRDNHRVLGGSPEPYVNNPLRVPAVIPEYREHQKAKKDWDKLVRVLDFVEEMSDSEQVELLFDLVLIEIRRLLEETAIRYPVPNRISLDAAKALLSNFLVERSGGTRMETVCTALFRAIGKQFSLFDRIDRASTNVADASSGSIADIECYSQGQIVLLVEVKDRTLTLTQIDSKLSNARSRGISEILFMAEEGKEPSDKDGIEERIRQEFVSGQNVYVSSFFDFSAGMLILLGELGRVEFLREIGSEMDRTNAPIVNRRAWSDLLRKV